jgi:transposase/DNA-binding transcriptional ArsR family regulator
MPRVIKIEIAEEASTLKKLLVQQKDKRRFERVQALYLLKIQQVETVEHLAVIIGRGRRTISRWLSQYRSGGLAKMLEVGKSPGKEPSQELEAIVERVKKFYKPWQRLRYWCQDESRMGLHTMRGRLLTLTGVKPKGKVQWKFQALWLYGLVEPLTGESFFYEFCHLDTVCFEKFLELFSQAHPEDIHIIQLDNGGCHQANDLSLPENVILLFQPSHCPEVNPIERLWEEIKKSLKWELFTSLEQLRLAIRKVLQDLNQTLITSVTGWTFIIKALGLAGI